MSWGNLDTLFYRNKGQQKGSDLFKVNTMWEILPSFFYSFASPLLTQNTLKQKDKTKQIGVLTLRGKMSSAGKQMSGCHPLQGTIFLTGKQERRDPKAGMLWAGPKALIHRGGCAGNCPPRRSSGIGCWTDCTSQLSPEQLYSYPQTLCTHQAGWPAGRKERRAGVGRGRED